jgi:hypothetical protein
MSRINEFASAERIEAERESPAVCLDGLLNLRFPVLDPEVDGNRLNWTRDWYQSLVFGTGVWPDSQL